ncbi:hypothetical protein FF38_03381 [Lucilia cuprina]|uniref:Chitin-binding type-2 domain-containing protein n=1 Tax=Lucilia cuprina TaxID=7375 RepID=A0A0L0C2G9_LUCCU|nr:hypothetical protein FF38_03381 [Lucilia cuprina]
MKSVIFFTILAFALACVLACDPDGNNQPECTAKNVNVPVRNFWDPTHYWLCKSAGAVAESVRCPDAEGFDSAKGACVPFIVCLTILAFAVAFVSACDPDGDNKPECNTRNVNVPTRNSWDPTHFWLCSSAGADAESKPCPIGEGFDATKGACVAWSEWKWTNPCPENESN